MVHLIYTKYHYRRKNIKLLNESITWDEDSCPLFLHCTPSESKNHLKTKINYYETIYLNWEMQFIILWALNADILICKYYNQYM